ncbi:CRISP/Allergen/PR-1 [Nymphon striatum]|nr:CRISP/Allergen/PR-1 [Nymphon striatum]
MKLSISYAIVILLTISSKLVSAAASVELCDTCKCYEKFSYDHTFCKSVDEDTCGTIKASGVTEVEKVGIVNLHNRMRSRVARGEEDTFDAFPTAKNMMQMATRFTVGQNVCHLPGDGNFDWNTCIFSWYYEIAYFYPELIDPFYDGISGHFTTMTWATTWKIGCGATNSENGRLMVCNYGPSGNEIGGQMYNTKGDVCSKCPSNTCCGCNMRIKSENPDYIVYEGLCRKYYLSVPVPVPEYLTIYSFLLKTYSTHWE